MTEATTEQNNNSTTGSEGTTEQSAPYYEGFKNEAIKTNPSVQLFKDPENLATAYVALEKRFGIDPNRRLDLPADPKDEAGWSAVWTKLGRPEKPEGYGMTLADGASDADKALLTEYQATAHKLGLPPDQAKGVMQFWMDKTKAANEAAAKAFTAQAEAGTAALKSEWGQAYDHKTREIGRLLNELGDKELVAELDGAKLGNYPNLAKWIGKVIDRMAEPGAAGGRSGDAAGDRALTPSQAKARANELEANPALRDASHPQHKAIVAERNKYLSMTAQAA